MTDMDGVSPLPGATGSPPLLGAAANPPAHVLVPASAAKPVDLPAVAALLRGLDRDQRRAVTHGDGPLLVVAGAGTGKTRVITRRIAWLIATKRARPGEIVALTFTDRAAEEMQNRVDELVPYGYVDTAISTFHAFGDRLVREHAFELGLPGEPRVLSRAEAVVFLREHLFDLGLERYRPLGDPTRFLRALVDLFSRAKDEDVAPARFLDYAERLRREAEGALDATRCSRASAAGTMLPGPGFIAGPETSPAGRDSVAPSRTSSTAGASDEETRALLEDALASGELARAYERYESELAAAGYLDFGDQVGLALRLLRERPAVRRAVQRRYRYVLVDEFQDTNPAQVELVGLIAGASANVTVVGDDDQAIYRFRGAAVGNILGFEERFPNAHLVVLRRNYRSRAPILEAAYRLIRHNDPYRLESRRGFDKQLVAKRRARRPAPVRHVSFGAVEEEADWIAGQIAARIASGTRPRDIAVLLRANADADPILRSLNVAGVPWRFSGGSGLYGRPEVRRLLAFLRAVADPERTVDVYALASGEPYRFAGEDLTSLLHAARSCNRSLWAVLAEVEQGSSTVSVSPETCASARRLVTDLRSAIESSHADPAGEVLYDFLKRSGLLAGMVAAAERNGAAEVQNVARFFDLVRRLSAVLPDERIPFLVPHLGTLIDAGDDPGVVDAGEDPDEVAVLTVHKAKGLEFSVVFLAGLAEGRFPARGRPEMLKLPGALEAAARADESNDPLAEERRLCYVAMTRARDELVLTNAADYGGRRSRRVSPFVAEALDLVPGLGERLAPTPLERLTVLDRTPVAASAAGGTRGQRGVAADGVQESGAGRSGLAGRSAWLSFSQIDEYLGCPARYRFDRVLRIPTPPHHALAYGAALHEAVAAFLRRRMEGAGMAEEELLAVLESTWSSEGFLSRQHEEARLEAGRRALRRFRAAELAAGAPVPVAVEQEFSVTVDGVRLRGRFDRVDDGPEGVTITDYKASDVRDSVKARRLARESLQLGVYALAYRELTGSPPVRLQLAFLETGVSARVDVDPRRLERARAQVGKAAAGIEAGDYTARPDAVGCSYCPFRDICPASAA